MNSNRFHVEEFVANCQAALQAPTPSQAIATLLQAVLQVPEQIRAALAARPQDAAHPDFDFFTRSANLTVFHGVLRPGFRNPPHNHGTWAVIGVYEGQEHNIFFRRAGASIVEEKQVDLVAPQVCVLAPEVIHAIANRLTTPCRAIHVYGNDHVEAERSMWDPFALIEHRLNPEQFRRWGQELMAREGTS